MPQKSDVVCDPVPIPRRQIESPTVGPRPHRAPSMRRVSPRDEVVEWLSDPGHSPARPTESPTDEAGPPLRATPRVVVWGAARNPYPADKRVADGWAQTTPGPGPAPLGPE